MRIPTWGEVEEKIRADLDLQDSDNFIGQDEMAGYGNEAISATERMLLKLREDYLLKTATITLVNGTANYDLPTDIYAQKIRAFVYINGNVIYQPKRLRDPLEFFKKAVIDNLSVSTVEYTWFLKSPNDGSQDQVVLSPPAYESGAYFTLYYIKHLTRIQLQSTNADSASRATQLATKIDAPECRDFIEQFIKVRCYEKMKDVEGTADAKDKLKAIRDDLESTLRDRVDDNDNEVSADISHYRESN